MKVIEEKDQRLLWMFTLRTGMYTLDESRESIVAFIKGYETGRGDECNFISALSESMSNQHKIKPGAAGWIGQIHVLAEKLNLDWVTVFKQQTLMLLVSVLDKPSFIEFSESLRRRVAAKVDGIEHHFNRGWIIDWNGIIDLESSWQKNVWTENERQLMYSMDKELRRFGKISQLGEVVLTNNLRILSDKLLAEFNTGKDR